MMEMRGSVSALESNSAIAEIENDRKNVLQRLLRYIRPRSIHLDPLGFQELSLRIGDDFGVLFVVESARSSFLVL